MILSFMSIWENAYWQKILDVVSSLAIDIFVQTIQAQVYQLFLVSKFLLWTVTAPRINRTNNIARKSLYKRDVMCADKFL